MERSPHYDLGDSRPVAAFGIWAVVFAIFTGVGLYHALSHSDLEVYWADHLLRRAALCGLGAAEFGLIYVVDRRLRGVGRLTRFACQAGLGVLAVALHASAFHLVYFVFDPHWGRMDHEITTWVIPLETVLFGSWIILQPPRWSVSGRPGAAPLAIVSKETAPSPGPIKVIWVREGATRLSVAVDDIVWIEAERENVRLHTSASAHLVRESLRNLEVTLSPSAFLRVHRSAIVRISSIAGLHRSMEGQFVTLQGGAVIPVGRKYAARLQSVCRT